MDKQKNSKFNIANLTNEIKKLGKKINSLNLDLKLRF